MERAVSVSIVAVAYGKTYRAFLPRWMRAISALERKPEKIVVVTDDVPDCIDRLGAADLASVTFKQAQGKFSRHPQYLINEAIAITDTDWVCKMDMDDLIFPHALSNLRRLDADVYMFGIQLHERKMPAHHATRADILKSPHNLVFSGSPFRRWVWEKSPFRDMICEDWVFWIDAAKNGARFIASPNIDYEYVIHGDNITLHTDMEVAESNVRGMR
jgi:hypothetical protein